MTNWRPPSLSELTPFIFKMELTHLGPEASIFIFKIFKNLWIINFEAYWSMFCIFNTIQTADMSLFRAIICFYSSYKQLFVNNLHFLEKEWRHFYSQLNCVLHSVISSERQKANKRKERICRPSSLSELTPIMFYMELTHLGSKASIFFP